MSAVDYQHLLSRAEGRGHRETESHVRWELVKLDAIHLDPSFLAAVDREDQDHVVLEADEALRDELRGKCEEQHLVENGQDGYREPMKLVSDEENFVLARRQLAQPSSYSCSSRTS